MVRFLPIPFLCWPPGVVVSVRYAPGRVAYAVQTNHSPSPYQVLSRKNWSSYTDHTLEPTKPLNGYNGRGAIVVLDFHERVPVRMSSEGQVISASEPALQKSPRSLWSAVQCVYTKSGYRQQNLAALREGLLWTSLIRIKYPRQSGFSLVNSRFNGLHFRKNNLTFALLDSGDAKGENTPKEWQ